MKQHFQLSKVAAALAVAGGVSLFGSSAMAANTLPPAGESISNIATASYTDATGAERTVSSNMVKTLVAQVGSFTLIADRESQTSANSSTSFSHILTNTGNGTDKFDLKLENLTPTGASVFDFTEIKVYLDKNQDGVPDSDIPVITYGVNGSATSSPIQLEANESTGIVIVAKTPATAAAGALDQLKLTATSTFDSMAKSNTDTAYIKEGAVIQVEKAASVSTSAVGGAISYTLKFNNKGTAESADPVTIYDILPKNVELVSVVYNGATYQKANVTGIYQYGTKTTGEEAFLLNVGKLAAGQSGQITLNVKVKSKVGSADVVDGEKIINTAYADTDGKTGGSTPTPLTPENVPVTPPSPKDDPTVVPSNPNIVTVTGIFAGSINDDAAASWLDGNVPSTGGFDDTVHTAAKQGEAIIFGGANAANGTNRIYVHNSGNTADSYNLSIDKLKFPTGSVIEFLKSDGKTPLISSNTGSIAPGSMLEIVVRVTLPSGQTLTMPPSGGLKAVLTSTSVKDNKSDKITLVVDAFTASSVDLVNKQGTTEYGQGTDTKDVPSTSVKPGSSTTLDVTIKNTGNTPDNYTITLPNIPDGWTVEIFEKNGNDCTTQKVTNSGNIAANSAKSFCLVVTPPAGIDAGTQKNIDVAIKSPSTGVADTIAYPVAVEQVRVLKLTQDSQGQVAAGGSIIYPHTLTNYGNTVEGLDASTRLTFDLSAASSKGEIITVYVDNNNNGVIDAGEQVLADGSNLDALLQGTKGADGLSPKESIAVFVKVEAPKSAAVGDSYTTTVTVVPADAAKFDKTNSIFAITDLTTVINEGVVTLVKTQAKSVCGTAPADSAYGQAQFDIAPGECVYYRIVATNQSKSDATGVTIYDAVPTYTTYVDTSAKGYLGTTLANTGVGISADKTQVSYSIGSTAKLAPTKTATLEFGVKVDSITP